MTLMIVRHGSFEIDDNRRRVDHGALWDFLSTEAYWGRFRTPAQISGQVASAFRVVAAYDGGDMVGFSRAWSDGVSSAYLGDVYVVRRCRGQGRPR